METESEEVFGLMTQEEPMIGRGNPPVRQRDAADNGVCRTHHGISWMPSSCTCWSCQGFAIAPESGDEYIAGAE